jgi:hypothetical protein
MSERHDFWLRPVNDRLTLELLPGDQPALWIYCADEPVLKLDMAEARRLIEVLTVAVGELLILKKDPATLARLQELLEKDVTLRPDDENLSDWKGGQ